MENETELETRNNPAAETENIQPQTTANEHPCCACQDITGTPAGNEPESASASEAPATEEVPASTPEAPATEDDNVAEKESGRAEKECTRCEREERPSIPVTQEMLDDVRGKLAMMLDFLTLDGTVRAEAGVSKINLAISSKDAGRIIGRKGQSLENLQLLLNRMMQKNDVNYPRIYIDIDGYSSGSKRAPGMDDNGAGRSGRHEHGEHRNGRPEHGDRFERRERNEHRGPRNANAGNGGGFSDSREEQLRMLALDSAKEVRKWGDPKTLPEMNSHDRRIIHLALEGEPDLSTESIGEEPHKSVVISLKK